MTRRTQLGTAIASIIVSLSVSFGVAELALRLKHRSMKNYDIEMWRYARELKRPSANPLLGHEHVPNRTALLQSAVIRLNERGLRGGTLAARDRNERRILFLGSSITLGWGVSEAQTVTARLEAKLRADGRKVSVLNAGVGNYNSARYVTHFLESLTSVEPTDIVVHYFLRDAEALEAGGGNGLLRNSQLAVTLWSVAQKLRRPSGASSLEAHYRAVYAAESPGRIKMEQALARLAAYAEANGIRVHLAMTPDVHDLLDYKFRFVHEEMKALSERMRFTYVDLLPALEGMTPEQVWSMPGDPHPNAKGHERMADTLYWHLRASGESSLAHAF